jgi:DNA integrity scanning protein DisA with diadenylate cyclase activity
MVRKVKVTSRALGNSTKRDVIKACMDIALQSVGHGCIFVIELNGRRREKYYAKVFQRLRGEAGSSLSVMNDADRHIIKHLAAMDGATLIEGNGEMSEFGATLKNSITFFGHGKRHAFALGTSRLRNLVCILASEEDRHVRLFKDGLCIVDVDSNTYVPTHLRYGIADMLAAPMPERIIKSKGDALPAMIMVNGGELMFSEGFESLGRLFLKPQ